MDGETRYLSRSKFAESQGWSPSYVTKLGKQGRLVLDEAEKLVDVPATLAILNRTKDPGKEGVRQHHADGRIERHVRAHTRPDAPAESGSERKNADPLYWNNKARREGALADLAEIELEQKRGSLVERDRVESMAMAVGRTLRDTLMGLPTRLAPELAGMSDPFALEMKLRDELREVLAAMSKLTSEDLVKAIGPTN